jgi:hypothetical protein
LLPVLLFSGRTGLAEGDVADSLAFLLFYFYFYFYFYFSDRDWKRRGVEVVGLG